MPSINSSSSDKVKIELSKTQLVSLLSQGALSGADCKCLDAESKQILWQSLLQTSVSNVST